MSLVDYSSTSESEHDSDASFKDNQIKNLAKVQKKDRIQLPNANDVLCRSLCQNIEETTLVNDNPDYHEGRRRSFKHERGNWATYIYIPISSSILDELQDTGLKYLSQFQPFHRVTNLHLSLSKTVVLPYHLIQSFTESIDKAIKVIPKFTMPLQALNTYSNSEESRTFLALSVDNFYIEMVLNLLQKINKVMVDFKLPTFYEDPSFHVSFLWCLDNKTTLVKPLLPDLYKIFQNHLPLNILVSEICCKSGHKIFTYKLS